MSGVLESQLEASDLTRTLDSLVTRLASAFLVTDPTQLPAKQRLLDGLTNALQIIETINLPGSPAEFGVAVKRGRSPSVANPVTGFKTASDRAMMDFRKKLLQIKQGLRADNIAKDLLVSLKRFAASLASAISSYESSTMEVRHYFAITAKIMEAKGLPSTSYDNSEVDSYTELYVDGRKKARTRTIWKTRNPCWSQDFYFFVPSDASQVEMRVFDASATHSDSFLGQVVVPIANLKSGRDVEQEWFPLAGEPVGHCGAHSRVQIQLEYKKSFSRHVGHLQVRVVQGSKILDDVTSDVKLSSFVELEIVDLATVTSSTDSTPGSSLASSSELSVSGETPQNIEKPVRTQVVRKDNNPEWNEDFQMRFVWGDNSCLKLSVVESTPKGKEKFIGHAFLKLADLFPNRGEDGAKQEVWVQLSPKPPQEQKAGQLRLSLRFREEKILPDSGYDELLQSVLSENFAVPNLLGQVASNIPEKKEIFRVLAGIFETKGKAVWLVTTYIENEIRSTNDITLLFRGNSIATVVTDVYMQLIGQQLLDSTLRDAVRTIFASKQSYELDPSRAEEVSGSAKFDFQKNLNALVETLNLIWDRIQEQQALVPLQLRQIFAKIHEEVIKKWPSEETTHYTGVTAFLFLRFFCAALLGPQLFGLIDQNPDPLTLRNLTIVAKVLMNMANLILFGKKEPHYEPINQWLKPNLVKLKQYVNTVISAAATDRQLVAIGPSINYGHQMSFLHRYLSMKRQAIQTVINASVSVPTPADGQTAAPASPGPSRSPRPFGPIAEESSDDESMQNTFGNSTYSGTLSSSSSGEISIAAGRASGRTSPSPRPEKSPLVSDAVRASRSSSVLRRRATKEMALNILKEVDDDPNDDAAVVARAVALTLGQAPPAPTRRSSAIFYPNTYIPSLRSLLLILDKIDTLTAASPLSPRLPQ